MREAKTIVTSVAAVDEGEMELIKRVLNVAKPSDPRGLVVEAWAEGYMVGSLVIMACVAFANMRRHVLLHKLILVEVRNLLQDDSKL